MRIIRFEDKRGQVQYGLDKNIVQNGVARGRAELLGGNFFEGLKPTGERAHVFRLLAPIVPTNILCIGRNYAEHAREFGNVVPEYPILFIKNNGSLNHPGAPIRLPKCQLKGPEVDYEGELAVVIGKAARNVTEEEALNLKVDILAYPKIPCLSFAIQIIFTRHPFASCTRKWLYLSDGQHKVNQFFHHRGWFLPILSFLWYDRKAQPRRLPAV